MSQFCEDRNGFGPGKAIMALIGIGANMPGPNGLPPLETCRKAVAILDLFPGARLCGLSRWFLSAPIPPSGQPNYINAVAALRVDPGHSLDPALLLARLMEIEAACGRQRGAPNAARTLDLDIIGISDLVRTAPDPVLPHPRAHQRGFVLAPLADVAPEWVHPVLGLTAAALLAGLPAQDIRTL
jgi:2-amino-4-hydroxy-6-hydroxymethyldihydropteridine diphosphokinase